MNRLRASYEQNYVEKRQRMGFIEIHESDLPKKENDADNN